ncbi:glutaminase [Oesophagostomum dentatum]|uniref:glutaminase n=1 Tax=Oesophagostomum dentatum TaxID=61180 RepID=A0A0B1T3U7_OESDE|nr:glutaminase [Oesophagostomum dentatum]
MMTRKVESLSNAHEKLQPTSPADLIFDLFKVPNKEYASITKLLKARNNNFQIMYDQHKIAYQVLRSFGLREKDPRLQEMMDRIRQIEDLREDDNKGIHLRRHAFKECISPSMQLISQALRNQMIIPSWTEFCGRIKEIFDECRDINSGAVATYIPQLARQNPSLWGMSICTIDGQRVSFGDYKYNFCFQSVSKAFNYSIVASDLGTETVHSYVGYEPSGRLFNEICLDSNGKPHNPMINSGAIIVTSLIKKGMSMADRFDFVLHEYRKLAGGEHIGFDNAT